MAGRTTGVASRTTAGRVTISFDGGFLNVNGPLNYTDISNLFGEDTSAPRSGRTSTRGLADTTLGLKYTLFEDFENGRFVDFGGRLRAPTASRSKGLGTGHIGGDLQLDVTQVLGPWSVFASGGYGIRNGRDADRNPWSASAGVGRTLTENLSAGTFYQWRQSARAGGDAAHEVFAYASYKFSPRFSLMVYGATGFSPESVGREIGIRYTYRWP